ncbi:uncharacterized protein A4U43_C04F17060 [Asparagus officinalis]|uniref:Uncharacterized protein n=1 Tax=Asparagus officinalis TaxID=4686 RepID=A0A5P1F477_ASPOF|nr:uncharacterized protein A4U43_C04F17060 [Asparagus officinalis]
MTMFFELNTGAKDPVVGLGTWQADAGGIRESCQPSSIHELLPDSVKSFSVSSNGHFTVNLQSPCYIHFDYLVHYADTITGVIKYGSTDELKGIKGIGVRLAMGELCAETWFLLIKEDET